MAYAATRSLFCSDASNLIDTGPADPQSDGDFRGPDACLLEPGDLYRLPPCSRHPALVVAFALGLGDAITLSLAGGRQGVAYRSAQPASSFMISERLRETRAQRVQALGSSGVPQLLGDIVIDMPYPGYPPL
jgi:hypothetical protein